MWKLILCCLCLIIFSCKEESGPVGFLTEDQDKEVKIMYSSGEAYGDHVYLPLLGNVSQANEDDPTEILILGKKLDTGSTEYIRPIGAMKYTEDDIEKMLIVAIPTNPQLRTIDVDDLVDFSVKYGSIKRIIEQWYASYRGLGKNRIIGWDNKTVALDVLNTEKE